MTTVKVTNESGPMIQIKLERIGDDVRSYAKLCRGIIDEALGKGLGSAVVGNIPSPCFCAEITGLHPKFKFERRFLKPNRDYSQANRTGSRGVYDYFNLEDGKIYDIKSPQSWKSVDRYYCRIEGGRIVRMDEDEVYRCLKNHSE